MRANVAQIDRNDNASIEDRTESEPSQGTTRIVEKRLYFSITMRRTRKGKERLEKVWSVGGTKPRASAPQSFALLNAPAPEAPEVDEPGTTESMFAFTFGKAKIETDQPYSVSPPEIPKSGGPP